MLFDWEILSSSAIMLTLWFVEIESWDSTLSIDSLFNSYFEYEGRLISKLDFYEIDSVVLLISKGGGNNGLPSDGIWALLTFAVVILLNLKLEA